MQQASADHTATTITAEGSQAPGRWARLTALANSRRTYALVVGAITVAAALFLCSVDRLSTTDDLGFLAFLDQVSNGQTGLPSLASWIAWRYENWSGRIVPEFFIWALTPISIWVWRAVALVLWVWTTLLAVRIVDVVRPGTTWIGRSGIAIGAFAVLFLMDPTVTMWGAFWVTGAMNYWWIIPFALAASVPVLQVLFRREAPAWSVIVLAALAAWVAAVSNEQVAAIVVVLGLAATVYRIVAVRRRTAAGGRRATAAVILPTFGALVGAVVLFGAPGNAVRPIVDEIAWLPGFSDASQSRRILGGIQFSLDGMVNHTGLLMILVWLALLVIILRSGRRDWIAVAGATTAILALTVLATAKFVGVPRLTEFSASWLVGPNGRVGWTVLVVWLALLIVTAAIPFAVQRNTAGVIQSLLIAAAYASTFVISFSPSMYASGPRVFFVSNAALAVTVLALLPAMFRGRTPQYVAGASTPFLAIAAVSAATVIVIQAGLR